MRGSDLAEAMASAVDQIVNAREGTGALDRAIFVHRRKHEQREQNRGVHRCTRTCTICKILVKLI